MFKLWRKSKKADPDSSLAIRQRSGQTEHICRLGNAQFMGARNQQQDAFGFSRLNPATGRADRGLLALLADGMGGLSGGGLTSRFTVETLLQLFDRTADQPMSPELLRNLILQVSQLVCSVNSQGPARTGTTLLAVWIDCNVLYWASIGDSRLYLLRGRQLCQCTEDQNARQAGLRAAIRNMTDPPAANDQRDGQGLTSFIGMTDGLQIELAARGYRLLPGDKLLLCTDGVYHPLDSAMLAECLSLPPQQAAQALISRIMDRQHPGQDNATALVLEYSGHRELADLLI